MNKKQERKIEEIKALLGNAELLRRAKVVSDEMIEKQLNDHLEIRIWQFLNEGVEE